MEPLNFIYWLQGYLELQDPKTIDGPKVQMIKDHLGLVLNKLTPPRTKVVNIGEQWEWKPIEQTEEQVKDFSSSAIIKFPYHNPPGSC